MWYQAHQIAQKAMHITLAGEVTHRLWGKFYGEGRCHIAHRTPLWITVEFAQVVVHQCLNNVSSALIFIPTCSWSE